MPFTLVISGGECPLCWCLGENVPYMVLVGKMLLLQTAKIITGVMLLALLKGIGPKQYRYHQI